MKKKHLVIVGVIILSAIVILGLYQTFALSGDITKDTSGYYNVTVNDGTTVNVPANSSKTVYYKLTNTNKGTVKYGVGYSGSNITVKYYYETQDPVTGTVDYGKSKFIKLYIQNTGSTATTATLSTILGYEKGGDLIVPTGVTLVNEEYKIYTITYNLNGASGTTPNAQTKLSGKSVILPIIAGSRFIGWSPNANANVSTYLGGSSFKMDSDVTFYAVWSGTTTGRGNEFAIAVDSNYGGSYKVIGKGLVDIGDDIVFSVLEEPSSVSGYVYSGAACDLLGDGENIVESNITNTVSSKPYGTLTERIVTVHTSSYNIDIINSVACSIFYKKA
jgi:hypothetical protein